MLVTHRVLASNRGFFSSVMSLRRATRPSGVISYLLPPGFLNPSGIGRSRAVASRTIWNERSRSREFQNSWLRRSYNSFHSGYLTQLPPDPEGVLLFIAPMTRFTTLWPELVARCKGIALPIGGDIVDSGETRCHRVGDRHCLVPTNWRALLAVILEALEAEGNQPGAADVRQLQGLCERMDSEAFLPLCSEDNVAADSQRDCAILLTRGGSRRNPRE
jgi:hypothetical protein